jgi:hypothetical protein
VTDDERAFERLVRRRIQEAIQITGYSFAGLLKLVNDHGAYETALRLISPSGGNIGRFPKGMRELFRQNLLSHSIEQAAIEFGEKGKLFTPALVGDARARLQLMHLVFSKR